MNLTSVPLEKLIFEIHRRGFSIQLSPSAKNSNLEIDSNFIKGKTLGGKKKEFLWRINFEKNQIEIDRIEANIQDIFSFEEIMKILEMLKANFNDKEIPLGNNVQKLKNNEEQKGIGQTIYDLCSDEGSKKIIKAQGASQLAPILEQCNILSWNGKSKGICFYLKNMPENDQHLLEIFRKTFEKYLTVDITLN